MLSAFAPPAPPVSPTALYDLLKQLGLTSSLVWCCDAGDANSNTMGQSMGAQPSGSPLITLGDSNAVEATADATPTGTQGRQSTGEYWVTSGRTTPTQTRLGVALGSWAAPLHKDNALFTFAAVVRLDSVGVGGAFLNTFRDTVGTSGISFAAIATAGADQNKLSLDVGNGSGSAFALTAKASLTVDYGAIMFVALSMDEAAGNLIFQKNAGQETQTSKTYSSPSTAAPELTVARLQAGNANNNNDGRVYNASFWNRALSATELLSLYTAQKAKFGF